MIHNDTGFASESVRWILRDSIAMLKWLPASLRSSPPKIITDDPLATIKTKNKSNEVYAVSRVNPLFIEDDLCAEATGHTNLSDGLCNLQTSDSSGYDSRGSSNSSSGAADEDSRIKDTEANILENGSCHLRSILVTIIGDAKEKPILKPIPEGRVEPAVPPPVWPRRSDQLQNMGSENTSIFYTSLRFDPTSRIHRKARRPSCRGDSFSRGLSTHDVLKNISYTINLAVSEYGDGQMAPSELLENLRDSINKKINALSRTEDASPLDLMPHRLAIDNTPKSYTNKTDGASNHERTCNAEEVQPQRGSCSDSSSGYSDLSPTTSSSTFQALRPMFISNNNAFGSSSLRRKNMIYGMLPRQHQIDSKANGIQIQPETKNEIENEVDTKEDKGYRYPEYQGIDFTLDGDQAEKLIQRLKSRKQQRCICRFIISLLGFFLFLLTVILVSMLLTKGKRIFGSL